MRLQLEQQDSISVFNTFLIEPVFARLLDTPLKSDSDWHHYLPSKSQTQLTLFKCTVPSSKDDLFRIMVDTPHLGLDKISNDFVEYQIDCDHFSILHGDTPKIIADIMNQTIGSLAQRKIEA